MHIEQLDNIGPLEAFASIRRLPMPFILSGGVYGGRRHSFIGAAPFMTLKTTARGTFVSTAGHGPEKSSKDPFETLEGVLEGFKQKKRGPFPFNGGAAGYFAYDLKDIIGFKKGGKADGKKSGLDLPLAQIGVYGAVFVHDHAEKRSYLVRADVDAGPAGYEALKKALTGGAAPEGSLNLPDIPAASGEPTSDFTREEYIKAVRTAQAYISEGDIYQINLSQRLKIPWEGDPFGLYARLLKASPAPFGSFMDFGGFQIISNSPERLLKVEGDMAETMPIKGTRPRGATPGEDERLIEELKKSPKERAEHVMVVDLERNDLGMVCRPGTVEVARFFKVETFPGLHHMVSTVRGRLDAAPLYCLRAVFPGGSVTGAPKVRAMEIISALEKTKRGLYTGGIGWMDFNGDMDVAMAIRTAVCKGGALHLGVGAGIVADSVAGAEYDETILKAKDFLEMIPIL